MVTYHQGQPEIKNMMVNEAVNNLGFFPMSFNTIALRLVMLAPMPVELSNKADRKIVIPSKDYIAVYGAQNGNNSGSYISIKNTVKELSDINFFKSIEYSNFNGGKATFTELELYGNQVSKFARFLKVALKAPPENFQKLRSNHAIRFYLFLNYILKNHHRTLNGSVDIVLNPTDIKRLLGMADQDYIKVGNLWGLIDRVIKQINQRTNINTINSALWGKGMHKHIQLTFGYKQGKD